MTAATISGSTAPVDADTSARSRYGPALLVGAVIAVLLVVGLLWSITLGSVAISVGTVFAALFHPGTTMQEMVVRTIRLPRALLSGVVGANMGVSGVVMQGITGNPLAAPEILGVSAGAAVMVVGALTFVPGLEGAPLVPLAFLGGAGAGLLVLALAGAGRGRVENVRLALAGFTIASLLLSATQGLIIFNDNDTGNVFFWLVGGVNFATWSDLATVAPWAVAGLIGAVALARSLDMLSLGEDLARGLGLRVQRTRLLGAAVIIGLVAGSVAVAGPITFVGLVVPHIVRRLVGTAHAVVIPLSALGGATLLIYADIASRFVNPPYEVPAGVVTALIGAPFFVALARRQRISA
ncbi:iron ABC transporter permease [Micromonospora yasonensis]|uniref:FecCD family ABC transporter permease n=1 Tax=Micromonospora yasonensis TaxID=1128667 RepID=UPI0022304596|nr:iron ABC transporter permease [Micromonospora yasonensis]MCW3844334.1 iron ABC transporter permease [Micromonospora yasonensis]